MPDSTQKVVSIPMGMVSVFLIKGKRSILVDTGFPGSAHRICKRLAKLSIEASELSLIFITHNHPDHTGSAAELKTHLNVPVAIHPADAEGLRTGISRATPVTGLAKIFARFTRIRNTPRNTRNTPRNTPNLHSPPCEPDVMLADGTSLEKYGVDATVIHTPGHTAGSCSIILSTGEAIVGDLIFGRNPFGSRKPGDPMFADNVEQTRESIARLLSLKPSVIYAAHGGPFTPEDVRKKFTI